MLLRPAEQLSNIAQSIKSGTHNTDIILSSKSKNALQHMTQEEQTSFLDFQKRLD